MSTTLKQFTKGINYLVYNELVPFLLLLNCQMQEVAIFQG